MFALQQQMYKEQQEKLEAPARGISLVMEKEEPKQKKKSLLRIKIKKRGNEEGENY